jgi:hypothetical protein
MMRTKLLMLAILAVFATGAFAQGGPVAVPFEGTCIDPEDGDLSATLQWSSDTQGPVGSGASGTMQLNEGVHVITATCDDSGPAPPQAASVTITVNVDDPPTVIIIQPVDGSVIDG